jgi:serine/threonine protein kinase
MEGIKYKYALYHCVVGKQEDAMSTSPRHLEQYELLQPIGQGHIGEVWQARDLAQQRNVALKLFHSDLQADPHFLHRLTSGGQMLTPIRRDNLVSVYEANIARSNNARETTAFIAMDYIEGYTLRDYLQATSQRGAFPALMDILYLFFKIGATLDYLHRNNIIHGDIKPNNILLNRHIQAQHFPAGEPFLTDVGATHIAGGESQLGAPHYISPEQAQGQPTNPHSDIYALGIILYELCTGMVPFRAENTTAILSQHIQTLPVPPMLINSSMSPALSEVILRAIAKEPASRFPTAASLTSAIAQACNLKPDFEIPHVPFTMEHTSAGNEIAGNSAPQMSSILGVSQPAMPANPTFIPAAYNLDMPINFDAMRAQDNAIPAEAEMAPMENVQEPTDIQDIQLPLSSGGSGAFGKQFIMRPASFSGIPRTYEDWAQPLAQKMPPMPPVPAPTSITPEPFIPPSLPDTPMMSMPYPGTNAPPEGAYQIAPPSEPEPFPFPQPPRQQQQTGNTATFKSSPAYKVVIALVLLFILIGGGTLGINLLLHKTSSTTMATGQATIYGKAFFQDDALGQNDVLQLSMSNLQNPGHGQVYYAWLQTNKQQPYVLLGKLSPQNKQATLNYTGDSQHSDLLAYTQGIIVTSEQSGPTPTQPGSDVVYHASFSQSVLPEIKAILYMTPNLPGNQPVALNLLNTIKSMNDKAASIVDSLQNTHDDGLAIRQATRIIEMVDSTAYAKSTGDLPSTLAPQLNVSVGLLSSPKQQGYIDVFSADLSNLKAHAGNNPTLLMRIQNVENALTDLKNWVQEIRTYDIQLLKAAPDLENMTDQNVALQLRQAVSDSYFGHVLPPDTGPTTKPGSAGAQQAYVEAQYMAELDLTAA